MAHTVQSVTLALTLPISCHICLGKVRQPVICVNHHVFCSVCIDQWLKNNNQCPVCRVPITPENPCKDIIGGASDNEDTPSHSIRKHLRKTRFELLHKEYEDEIESLIKETEELRRANIQLEERLAVVTDTATMSDCNCENKQVEDKKIFCDKLLEDWNKKLEMVNAANKKVTEDIHKLKEENRRLKNENIECARENLRLKNEVELRSPQKFGRFTVAALQAKVEQYEREMSRLKKALERSDQYIEELENQIVQLKKTSVGREMEKSQCQSAAVMEEHASRPAASQICQNIIAEELYPKDSHETGASSKDSACQSSTKIKLFDTISKLENELPPSRWAGKESGNLTEYSPRKGIATTSQDFGSPSAIPFSALHLKTPDSKTSSFSHAHLKKPLTYLRKLTFDELPKKQEVGISACLGAEQGLKAADRAIQTQQPNTVFLNVFHNNGGPMNKNSENLDMSLQLGKPGADQALGPQTLCDEDLDQPRMSSKNSIITEGRINNGVYHGSMSHLPPNVFIPQPMYPDREVAPRSTSVALPEHNALCLPHSYGNSPPAKRKLLNSCSDSPSKSPKH